MNSAPYARDEAPLAMTKAEPQRPILLAHGGVLTRDIVLGDWADAGVLIGGALVVGVGPGLDSAADDDGMIVVDCRGCLVMSSSPDGDGRLIPGVPATIAVYRVADPETAPVTPIVNRASHLDIQLVDGKPVIWGGRPVDGLVISDSTPRLKLVDVAADAPRLGLWSDERGFLRQRLLPDGRYDEARGERDSAYRGRFWIDGDRIDYLDDEGFWAFGVFANDRLEHAGYVLSRSA